MSKLCMILGESGTGKSTAIRALPKSETFLISVLNKDLPFRKWKDKYRAVTKENPKGNYYCTDNYDAINKILESLHDRAEIKTLIIDDFNYLITNEFMRRHSSAGKGKGVFTLYNEIADHVWNLIMGLQMCRENLTIVIMAHNERDDSGQSKMKTIGKLLNEKVCLEGMIPIVLNTKIEDGSYYFETQNNGSNTSKSPVDMFKESKIPNDLNVVVESIRKYY